jgi:hypothetical protein
MSSGERSEAISRELKLNIVELCRGHFFTLERVTASPARYLPAEFGA